MLLLLLVASPALGQDSPLIGNWRLVAQQSIIEGQAPQDLFGKNPRGYLIITREGRMMGMTTAENRKAGMNDTERAELHKSMLAYSGKYRVEGADFVTTVDISWNEAWNGTEQKRHFRIEGDKLYIEGAPQPSTLFPGKTFFARLVWEREK